MALTLGEFALNVATALLKILPQLLRAFWLLASGSVLLTILPLPLLPSAVKAAVRLAAARGKLWHTRPTTASLGFLQDLSVPQQYFEHFYIVGALVNTVLLQVYIFVCCPDEDGSTLKRDSLVALILFELHLVRRYLETNYLLHYPDSASMHLLAYLFGLSYYVAVPLSLLPTYVMDMGVVRGAWDLAMGEGKQHWTSVDQRLMDAIASPHPETRRLAAGVALFVVASLLQFVSHAKLGRMARQSGARVAAAAAAHTVHAPSPARGAKRGAPVPPPLALNEDGSEWQPAVTDVYAVPRGGVFDLVCCPHYLAEILIYVALAVVTRGTPGSLLIVAWVLLNLVLAAGATKRFYRDNFKEYPPRRAALVPGLF